MELWLLSINGEVTFIKKYYLKMMFIFLAFIMLEWADLQNESRLVDVHRRKPSWENGSLITKWSGVFWTRTEVFQKQLL